MANVQAFAPVQGLTRTIAAGVGNVTGSTAIFTGSGYRQVRIFNEGTATAWVRFGASNVTAVNTADMPVAAGSVEVVTVPADSSAGTFAAIYTAAATGNVYFTPGSGL